MNFYMPARLYVGSGCIAQHLDEISSLGDCCLVVTDGVAAKASGALSDVTSVLDTAHIDFAVWDGVSENPPVRSCLEAGLKANELGATFVVGIGGGSALDAAKAVSVFAANPTLDEDGFYGFDWQQEPLPIVLVGTTAGTGSEVTKVSVLTDSKARKHSIHDDRLFANLSFGDSTYTRTCPHAVTLSCGVDVLAHATESYFSRKADQISRAFAISAIRLAAGPLGVAARGDQLTDEQRDALYEASILGGLAINTTGTCFPHNVGYYLTENYHVPHGFASAVFLPQMLEWASQSHPGYSQEFFALIGMSREEYVKLIERCLPQQTVSMSEREVLDALPRWDGNGSVLNTITHVSVDMIRQMLDSMFV
ncbi:MAG: iron-containing alcohol dehydrogenase [Coriobacteriales bacterium]|nr:iron-containing alcohol dehydrogenase [Coriobacteriales bacterium]